LVQAVLAYRHEYLVEHGFGRLKGKPLSLTPMYLQDDQRATGVRNGCKSTKNNGMKSPLNSA